MALFRWLENSNKHQIFILALFLKRVLVKIIYIAHKEFILKQNLFLLEPFCHKSRSKSNKKTQ